MNMKQKAAPIYVVDDEQVSLSLYRTVLEHHGIADVQLFQDAAEVLSQIPLTGCSLMLLDLHMPGVSGFAGLVYLCKRYPSVPVVIISANEDPVVIQRALQHGAAGFIPKSSSSETITTAIAAVLMGEIWSPDTTASNLPRNNVSEVELAERMSQLTPQQFKVLMMMSQGLLNKQIAYELKVSEATIKAHVTAIMSKLGVKNRTQAVLAASQLSVTNPSSPR